MSTIQKKVLERKFSKINTKYGEITIKSSYYNGKLIKSKPEYEDCKKIARENNVAIRDIYEEAILKIKTQ